MREFPLEYTALAVLTAIIIALLAIGVVGCGSIDSKSAPESDAWHFIAVSVPDGRPVVCVTNDLEDALSCDWDHR